MDRGLLGLVIYMSRLVGVAPYMRRSKDGVSKPLFVFSVIAVGSVSFYIVLDIMFKVMSGNLMMLDIIHIFGNCLLVVLVLVGACTSIKRIAHMVQNLRKLDKIHENIRSNGFSVLGLEGRRTHYLVWIYILGVITMHVTDYFLKKTSDNTLIFEICMGLAHTWVELCLLQVILFSEKVLITLEAINETLHQLPMKQNEEGETKYKNNKAYKPKLAFIHSRDDAAYLEDFHDNTNWRRSIARAVTSEMKESIEYTIRRLTNCYTIICEIVRDTIHVNGLLLIMALLNHMLHLELTTYYIILWMKCENDLGLELIFLGYHDLSHVFGLFLLVDYFHQTHAEMDRTELLVKCLKYENDPSVAMNNELDLFQRILILQSTKYSPLDMCTLDRSLLVKVFGMLISYLVIIVTYGL